MPVFDISDDVLERLVSEPSTPRRPTSRFFHNQRKRAGIIDPERLPIPPTQAELDRRPLDAEDIIYMFAGAPYFSVEDDAGNREPRVVHGWAPTVAEPHDAVDYTSFQHESFSACTIDGCLRTTRTSTSARRQVREVPSMLSADGKDPGTMGFTHFLELPLRPEQYMDDAAVQRQDLLVTDPETLGLRDFDIENIADRLAELAKVYEMLRDGKGEASDWDQHMVEDIGEDLFSTLLRTDIGTTPAGTGSVSLYTQVSALQKVLASRQTFFNFTNENWRVQLGQLMWQPRSIAKSTDGGLINERDILLLQIALSAELAVRFEIAQRLAGSDSHLPGIFEPGDLEKMLCEQTVELDWDMVLFQRFVDCFEISSRPQGPRRTSLIDPDDEQADTISMSSQQRDLVFLLRKEQEQWDGLHVFASSLGWSGSTNSDYDDSSPASPAKGRPDSFVSQYDTPMTSPVASLLPPECTPALILLRSEGKLLPHSAFDRSSPLYTAEQSQRLHWLTKTWLSGFFMPGATVHQFLLHALLETSPGTKNLLPEAVNSNDGFVHEQQMYWSKESVVGRVLAPIADAKECTGWLSIPFVPQGQSDGWIQPLVKEPPSASLEPRINLPGLVSRTSDPLHCHDATQLQAGDFTTIMDSHIIMGNEARLEGVSLRSSNVVQHTADGFLVPKTVNLTFKSPRNSKLPSLTLPLKHAVCFVSSYPCYPDTRPRTYAASSAHDSCMPIDSGCSTPLESEREKDLPLPPCHPLHVDYTYTIIPAAALLSSELTDTKDSDSLILMDSAEDDNPSIYQIEDQEVIVLDCRGSPDLEVLARAWCAKAGEHALVGKTGRTCLACCIREAISLGIGIVLRT